MLELEDPRFIERLKREVYFWYRQEGGWGTMFS